MWRRLSRWGRPLRSSSIVTRRRGAALTALGTVGFFAYDGDSDGFSKQWTAQQRYLVSMGLTTDHFRDRMRTYQPSDEEIEFFRTHFKMAKQKTMLWGTVTVGAMYGAFLRHIRSAPTRIFATGVIMLFSISSLQNFFNGSFVRDFSLLPKSDLARECRAILNAVEPTSGTMLEFRLRYPNVYADEVEIYPEIFDKLPVKRKLIETGMQADTYIRNMNPGSKLQQLTSLSHKAAEAYDGHPITAEDERDTFSAPAPEDVRHQMDDEDTRHYSTASGSATDHRDSGNREVVVRDDYESGWGRGQSTDVDPAARLMQSDGSDGPIDIDGNRRTSLRDLDISVASSSPLQPINNRDDEFDDGGGRPAFRTPFASSLSDGSRLLSHGDDGVEHVGPSHADRFHMGQDDYGEQDSGHYSTRDAQSDPPTGPAPANALRASRTWEEIRADNARRNLEGGQHSSWDDVRRRQQDAYK